MAFTDPGDRRAQLDAFAAQPNDGIFKLSQESQRMIAYLRAFDKGTQIGYDELSRVAEATITSQSKKLSSVRYILERDYNAVWVPVRPCIGIRRLDDVEIAKRLAKWWLFGARRKLKRGGDQSEMVELAHLNIDQQTQFSVDCIQRELAMESLSKATRRKMEKTARGTSNDLPAFTAIEWAISLSPRRRGLP